MEKTIVSKEDPKGLDIKTVIGTFTAEQYKHIQDKFATDDAVSCAENQGRARTTVLFEKDHLRISPLDVYAHRGSKVLCLDDYPVGDKAMCFVDIAQRIQGKNEYYPKEGDLVSLLNESVVFMRMPDHKRQFQNLWRVSKYITSDDRAVRPQIFVKSVVTNDEIQVNGWLGSPTIDVIIDYYKSLSIVNILHNAIKDSEEVSAWLNSFLRRQVFDRDFVFADEQSSFKEHTNFLNVGFSDDSGKSLKDIWNESGEIMRRTYAGIKPEQSLQFKLGPIEITKQEPQEDGTVKITFGADMHFEERKTGMSQEDVKEATDALKDILSKGKTLDGLLSEKEMQDKIKLNPLDVKSEKQHNKDRAFYLTDKIKICLGKDIKVNQAWIDELNELLTKFSEEYYGYDERNS